MFIITIFITIASVLVIQLSPAAVARDVLVAPKAQVPGQVMGIVEINDRQERLGLPPQAAMAAAPAPAYTDKPLTPMPKNTYQAPPEITAVSAAVFDIESRKLLYEKNPDAISPIASITKLMTALVALEQNPDFAAEYVIDRVDRREGGRIFLYWGDRVTIDDLFHASLVGSGNTETIALVHSLGMTEADFVAKMNAKAAGLGLRKTTFADATGLNDRNTSTAYELIEIVRAAMAQEKIRLAVTQTSYTLTTKQGTTRVVESTDTLLKEETGYRIVGGKTGYIGSAGFCFVGKFRDQNNEHPIISVVLGSKSLQLRFEETDRLVRWAYENYEWK